MWGGVAKASNLLVEISILKFPSPIFPQKDFLPRFLFEKYKNLESNGTEAT